MSDWFFDHHSGWHSHQSALGPEYLLSDSGQLSAVSSAQHGSTGGTSTGGGSGSPLSTLVGAATGLQIDLLWDSSVRAASNWSAIESAVVQAAKIFTSDFTNHAVLNIAVGLGEVAGSKLAAGALGESESLGYLTSYATVTKALTSADAGLVSSGQMAAGAVTADTALSGSTFFLASAEAKALGLVNPTSTGVDGYIGLTSGSALYYPAGGGQIGASQYDAVGVAAHELSEVMGRLGMEGAGGRYTPLDLFRYTAPNTPGNTPAAGYFSTNFGTTSLNLFNNPANGGDAADWATTTANARDAFDAFGNPGVITQVTATDLLEVASLGYKPVGTLSTVTA